MIPGGYILQPRSFDASDAAKFPPATREVWLYVLRNVNHKDNGKFKRGSGFFNIAEIQEALSWRVGYRKMKYSKTQIAKSLRRLCEDAMTTTTKTTRGLIVTVCNYDKYQTPSNYEDHNEDRTKTLRRPRQGNTINKNDKKKNKETTLPAWLDLKLWAGFKKMRLSIKKPITELAEKRLLNKLKGFIDDGHSQEEVIGQAIEHCWQTFYAPKTQDVQRKRRSF